MIVPNSERKRNFILGVIFGILLYLQMLLQNLANLSLIGPIGKNVKYFYIFIFIISLVLNINYIKDLVYFIPFVFFGIFSYSILKDMSVLGLFLVAFSLRRIEVYNILKIFFYTYWSLFTTMMCFLFLRVTTNIYQTSLYGEGQGWTFGFSNHNAIGRVLMTGCMINLVIRLVEKKKYSKFHLIIWWATQIILYYILFLTSSSSAIIAMVISLLCYLFISKFSWINRAKKAKLLGWASYSVLIGGIIFTLLSLTEKVFDTGSFWYTLNKLMTGRLALGELNNKIFGLSIWGNPAFIPSTENVPNYTLGFSYNYVDNSYLFVMMRYGSVFLVLLTIYYLMLIRKIVFNKFLPLFIPVITLSFYGIAENIIYSYVANCVLLWLGIWLFSTKAEIKFVKDRR